MIQKLKIRFWGVRGSFPVTGKDTVFFGGNTSCVQISDGKNDLIFDSGSGIRHLGNQLIARKTNRIVHLLFSHYHLDHIMGLPFFKPIYSPKWKIHLYGPKSEFKTQTEILSSIFGHEFFPINFAQLPSSITHHELGEERFKISNFNIESYPLNHPGNTIGYLIQCGKKKIGYLTDSEPIHRFVHHPNVEEYHTKLINKFYKTDLLIHDAHFSDGDYPEHCGWGHTSWSDAIAFAKEAKVGKLVLFHHALNQTDRSLEKAQKQLQKREKNLKLLFAREGQILKL